MTDFPTVWQGILIMFVCIVISLVMIFQGGIFIDKMHQMFDDAGYYDSAAGQRWHSGSLTQMTINMYYGVCVFIGIFGIIAGVGTILRRQQYDRYVTPSWRY